MLAFVETHRVRFVAFSMLCFLTGLFVPFVHISPGERMGPEGVVVWLLSDDDTYSLPQSVFAIWHDNWIFGVAAIAFSLVLPICKMAMLFYCCARRNIDIRPYRQWLEVVGPWSMLEVFLLALLLLATRSLPVGTVIHVKMGFYLFVISVFTSMIIAKTLRVPLKPRQELRDMPADVII